MKCGAAGRKKSAPPLDAANPKARRPRFNEDRMIAGGQDGAGLNFSRALK